MGAPAGNQNAVKGKRWQQAIDRALAKRGKGDGIAELDRLAEKFLDEVERGNREFVPGFSELGDRLDGRPKQETDVRADLTVHGLADIIGGIGQGEGEHPKVET